MRYPVDFETNNNGWEFLDYVGFSTLHSGKDFNYKSGESDFGLPVRAITKGEVVYAQNTGSGWGNLVIIYHENYGIWTRSAHLNEIYVSVGDTIDEGTAIGTIGNTGGDWSSHLHFDIIKKKLGRWTDYTKYWSQSKVKEYYADPMVWIPAMIKEEESHQPSKDPEIVAWCKKSGIITKFSVPPLESEIKDAYVAYKTGYFNATPAKRKKYYTIQVENEKMDEYIKNFNN